MIDQLPAEIIVQVLGYLPTVSSIFNVSSTNRKLRQIVREGSNSIFHNFVIRSFPSIHAQGPWQETAFALTSRSRAFDRRAFVVRECAAPEKFNRSGPNEDRRHNAKCPTVIDSYETALRDVGTGKEVLAWAVAGRLRLRTSEGRSVSWSSFRVPFDDQAWMDILNLRLLRPHQNRNSHGESIVIQRACNEITLLHSSPETDEFFIASKYNTNREHAIQCMDVSDGTDPKLAVCNDRSFQLFPVLSDHTHTLADVQLNFPSTPQLKQRRRCARFLAENKIAVAAQYLEGKTDAPIQIFDLETTQTSLQLQTLTEFSTSDRRTRNGANVMARLNENNSPSNLSENLLLAGCSDGLVRLYDFRTGSSPVCKYWDPVDDGQILSLVAVGQEKFFAGGSQIACLKMFDMRRGASVYDYTKANLPSPDVQRQKPHSRPVSILKSRRDINVFISVPVFHSQQLWRPLPRKGTDRLSKYQGSIYSLSSPSSSSRTIYAGIENHVIQFDFVNSDDFVLNRGGIRDTLDHRRVLALSCYEKPREGFERTDAVLLRTQKHLSLGTGVDCEEPGWDMRWQLQNWHGTVRRGTA